MAVRYIGSKARIASAILDRVGEPRRGDGSFLDAFAGTGVVAEEAARRGWSVKINDHLLSATAIAAARVTTSRAARFRKLGGYKEAVRLLNDLPPRKGFFFKTYSPASALHGPHERRYFTRENAGRIDAIRGQISRWDSEGLLSSSEQRVLIADLLLAANGVANIAGTYGCFMREFLAAALRPLTLRARTLETHVGRVEVFNTDVAMLPALRDDVAYLDPPYTKRQYAAYYHILETIAHGDRPSVVGVTGLRPWRSKLSDFCYKVRALEAIRSTVVRLSSRRVFISYSSEGHVALDQLCEALKPFGRLVVHQIGEVGRYRPNQCASDNSASVSEYLLELTKSASGGMNGTNALTRSNPTRTGRARVGASGSRARHGSQRQG